MTDVLDKSLDQIIKQNKATKRAAGKRGGATGRGRATSRGRGRGTMRGRGRGATRGVGGTGVIRGGIQKRGRATGRGRGAMVNRRLNQKLTMGFQQTVPGAGAGKLLISNLHFGVTDTDMHQLFGEFGQLRKVAVHYGGDGRSLGTAEVILPNKGAAVRAFKKYNQVKLDGRAMNIELVGGTVVKPPQSPQGVGRGRGRGQGARGRGRGQATRGRGGKVAGVGRGASQKKKQPTAEELDAQLDAYHKKEAMDVDDATAKFYPNQKLLS